MLEQCSQWLVDYHYVALSCNPLVLFLRFAVSDSYDSDAFDFTVDLNLPSYEEEKESTVQLSSRELDSLNDLVEAVSTSRSNVIEPIMFPCITTVTHNELCIK